MQDNFEGLVEEVANKVWDIDYPHTRQAFVDIVKQVVSELQKRQEAVAWLGETDGELSDIAFEKFDLLHMESKTPLFRFPPSCETKVNELENKAKEQGRYACEMFDALKECQIERDQLREQLLSCKDESVCYKEYARNIITE